MSIHHQVTAQRPQADLSRFALFRGLSLQQLAHIERVLQWRPVRDKTTIIAQGETGSGLWLLLEGTVKVSFFAGQAQNGNGKGSKEVIVAICGPGETLGEIDMADGRGHTACVNTLEESLFLWISSEDFWQCQEMIPLLGRNLSRLLAERLRDGTTMHGILATLHLPGKVAGRLLLLADRYGVPQSDGEILLPLCLSQREMAGLVGTSRECINRVLAGFKERGFIQTMSKKQLLIRDVPSLHSYCEGLIAEPIIPRREEHDRGKSLIPYSLYWLQLLTLFPLSFLQS